MPYLARLLRTVIYSAFLVFLSTSFASADNLVSDPTFDDPSMTQWPPLWVVDGVWEWDALDREGPPSSGSGRFDNLHTGDPQYTLNAGPCIDGIIDSYLYDASIWVYYPPSQTPEGDAFVQLSFYQDPGCSTHLNTVSTEKIDESVPSTWRESAIYNASPPSGSTSVRFVISLTKINSDDPLSVHYDSAEFRSVLFRDGFESGDTTAWSSVNPSVPFRN